MAISSVGVGSGLPVDKILADLRKVENMSLALIQDRKSAAEARLSGYSQLKSSLDALQGIGKKLADPAVFSAYKATSSNEAIQVTANNKSIAGSYDVEVKHLATAQRLTKTEDRTKVLSDQEGGKISVTMENGDTHEVDLDGFENTMEGMVQAINSDPKLGIRATLINDDGGKSHLVISSSKTGTANSVSKIEVKDNDQLNDFLGFDANNTNSFTVRAAQNAELSIDGITITSQSNTVENAIEGVTLTLNQTTSASENGKPSRVAVTRDDAATSKLIQEFVTAYNNLNSTIAAQTKFDIDKQQGSALTGEALPRRMQADMREAISHNLSNGDVRNLSQLGIKINPSTGVMELDQKKLDEAIKENYSDVAKLFTGEKAIGQRLVDNTETYLKKKDGLLALTSDSITKNIKDIDKQMLAAETRIETTMEAYRKQFSSLDKMMSDMGGISNYLSQQLSMLGNMSDKK
ncbi:flagellar filament capping protein FliD [Paenalcaligenes sp. Me52]|uniref:flagellar filament capping protein FliD n=1 Tax=Paenalcaligenes sp. Me52 TaxID=3392038 RepID=UPI003D2DAD0D